MPKTDKSAPKMRPAPEHMKTLFERVVGPLPEAKIRKMFGYPAAFVNGNLFSGLFDDYMMLRLSPDDLKAFFKLDGTRPFAPMPGRPMREYAVVPPALLKSDADLFEWLGKAYDYAKSLPPKKPKKKKR
jgi:TfoX/Sxy family transcriptional regulator of competence genes